VFAKEQAMLSRVQEHKDSVIAFLFEEKLKWQEDKCRLEAKAAGGMFPQQVTTLNSVGATTVKPEHVHNVLVVPNGLSPPPSQAIEVDAATPKLLGISTLTPSSEAAAVTAAPAPHVSVTANKHDSKQDSKHDATNTTNQNSNMAPVGTAITSNPKPVVSDVRVRPQLKALCENMDGDGLRKFLVDHRKDVGAMRTELPPALQCAIDPARMVLGALDGYHLPEPGNGNSQPGADKNKDSGASANRRACILLLECLAVVLADPVLGADHPVVPSNIKESAKQLADQWKSKMNSSHGDATGNSLDAQSFLQLLATFGIAPEYNDDELCKLVTAVARRRQTPVLCRSLGLSSKIPG
jgi:hypothetical protein